MSIKSNKTYIVTEKVLDCTNDETKIDRDDYEMTGIEFTEYLSKYLKSASMRGAEVVLENYGVDIHVDDMSSNGKTYIDIYIRFKEKGE